MKTSFVVLPFACVAVLSLVACDSGGPAKAAAPPVAKKAPPPAPAAAVETPLLYAYNPTGKRDPFRSPVAETRTTSANAACSDPLCQFDLDQLTLVAVVTGDANPLAMVEDPQGRGYLVRRNARMGKAGGKVTQILHNSITVTELFTGPDGKVTANPVSVGLKQDAHAEHDLDFMTGRPVP